MTMLGARYKDPDSTKDYTINWAAWLGQDTIVSAVWTVPAGITKASESHTTTTATIWLSGGTIDQVYTLQCRITTVGGRTEDESFSIKVRSN